MKIRTPNLELVLQSPDQVRAMINALPPSKRGEVSPDWLARISSSALPDPWLHGFAVLERASGSAVGNAVFKGPPDEEGTVEIAYGIAPEHRGKGFATEAAAALTRFAFATRKVRIVRAQTRPETTPSSSVLAKCGFRKVSEVIDAEDGLVWRWQRAS